MDEAQDENPARTPPDLDSKAHITAEHEAAHALAYIHFGLDFTYASAVEAYTAVEPRRIGVWESAVIAVAGLCVQLRYLSQRFGAAEGLTRALDSWQDTAEVERDGDGDGDGDGDSDLVHTHGLLSAALPFAHALVAENYGLIQSLGAAILRTDPLSYDEAIAVLGDQRSAVSGASLERSLAMFAPHDERLNAIDQMLVSARHD